jgi:nucleoside phosphorylase
MGKRKSSDPGKNSDLLIDFAIITAVEIEKDAVCKAFNLTHKHRVRKGPRIYWRGRLRLKDGDHYEIVVAQPMDMAQVDAAILTTDLIHHWNPAALLMVGIAGAASDGSKDDDEALGDLVVGRDVYYYERGKVTADGKRPEPVTYRADATLLNNFMSLPPLRSRILVPRPDGQQKRPQVIFAAIASGEKVIADAAVRDQIVSHHRKTSAIEMEGYGFSAAVWQSFEHRRHLVMKAICDRADRNKAEDWQHYAAAVAAQYARHFLRDRPIDPRNKKTEAAASGNNVTGTTIDRQEAIPGVGPQTARSWVWNAINPLLRALEFEQELLERKYWRWQYRPGHSEPGRLEFIRQLRHVIHHAHVPIFEQFIKYCPNIRESIEIHDQEAGHLFTSCMNLQQALLNSPELKETFKRVTSDEALSALGKNLGDIFPGGADSERLGWIAQEIINGTDKLPSNINHSPLWNKYQNEFLALRDAPEIRREFSLTNCAGEKLLQTVRRLTTLLSAVSDQLTLPYDVPVMPP